MVRTFATVAVLLLLCSALLAQSRQEMTVSTPPLPDAPSPQHNSSSRPAVSWIEADPDGYYTPLTSHEKLVISSRRTYSPWTFVGAAWDAGISQATSGHEAYGQGMNGYGKRFGASVADDESGLIFGSYLLPTIFHQDPRYFRRPELPFFQRGLYSVSRVFLTRTDSGRTAVNISYLGGSLIGTSIANTYYPFNERGISNTFIRFGSGILSTAGMNVWHEFWPDFRDKLKRTHTYQRLSQTKVGQRVEQKMDQFNNANR